MKWFEILEKKKVYLHNPKSESFCVWVYIFKENEQKLEESFWQKIFVRYKDKNQYWIYNS